MQNKLIIQASAAAIVLLVTVVLLVVYRDMYIVGGLFIIFVFLAINLIFRYDLLAHGQCVILESICKQVETTAVVKRIKFVVVEAEGKLLKLRVTQRRLTCLPGCVVRVYYPSTATVHESGGIYELSGYWALEIFGTAVQETTRD